MSNFRLAACLAMAVMGGCTDPTGPGPLALTLEAAADTLHAPTALSFELRVTNIGLRTAKVPEWICPAPFTVHDVEGRHVGPASGACLAVVPALVTLTTGESQLYGFQWDGTGLEGELPGGRYRVTADFPGEPTGPTVEITLVR